MSCESHFNSALNNSGAAEFVRSLCSAFGCLAWEAAHAEMLSSYRMGSPGVFIAGNLRGRVVEGAAW